MCRSESDTRRSAGIYLLKEEFLVSFGKNTVPRDYARAVLLRTPRDSDAFEVFLIPKPEVVVPVTGAIVKYYELLVVFEGASMLHNAISLA
jgi:hypothetical protein